MILKAGLVIIYLVSKLLLIKKRNHYQKHTQISTKKRLVKKTEQTKKVDNEIKLIKSRNAQIILLHDITHIKEIIVNANV